MNCVSELRKLTGLSQAAFADMYKVPVSTLRNWEQGTRSCPPYVFNWLSFRVNFDLQSMGDVGTH